MSDPLHPAPGLEVRIQPTLSESFRRFLEEVIYGTSGVQYRALDMDHVAERLEGHSEALELLVEGELRGTYLLVTRPARAPRGAVTAVYRTCLSIAASVGGRGLGRVLVEAVREGWLTRAEGRRVLYGTIDPTNQRSQQLAEKAGYQPLASLKVVTFTRLLPWRSKAVGWLREEEREDLLSRLEEAFGDRTLFDAPVSLNTNEVLAYRGEAGELLAAVQLVPKRVQLHSLGGRFGRTIVRLGRHLPGIGRFFRPTTIVQASALWAREGERERLIPLLEHAMREHRASTLVLLLDPREPLHAWLAGAMRLGWIQFWTPKWESVRIMAGTRGIDDDELALMRERPFWVSALDLE